MFFSSTYAGQHLKQKVRASINPLYLAAAGICNLDHRGGAASSEDTHEHTHQYWTGLRSCSTCWKGDGNHRKSCAVLLAGLGVADLVEGGCTLHSSQIGVLVVERIQDRNNNMESNNSRATDVLGVVVLSGVTRSAEMELVCLAVCNACRENGADYSLMVKEENLYLVRPSSSASSSPAQQQEEEETPPPPSSPGSAGDDSTTTINTSSRSGARSPPSAPRANGCSRVAPHRRVHSLALRVDVPLSQVVWPDGLRVLKFGWRFDRPLDRPLPGSLLDLDLGNAFNYHVEEVAWPAALQSLTFGERFNRQVELATWPATLKRLSFGSSFDQPIAGVRWPASLRELRLGDAFNHPVNDWAGATGLKKLEFGTAFRCNVDDVRWPKGLRELKFGACFDQELQARELPRSLRVLRLPDVYAMHDTLDPEGLPDGCKLCFDRTELFDLLLY